PRPSPFSLHVPSSYFLVFLPLSLSHLHLPPSPTRRSSDLRTARHFDLAMANLTARIILEMVPNGLQHVVWPGSKMVFSGIIQEQVDEVIAALEGIDLEVLGQRHIDDWVMLITQRRIP